MNNFKSRRYVTPAEIAPRHEHGVDYGRDGTVLARFGDLRLVWRGGGKYWSGLQGNRYAPAALVVLEGRTTKHRIHEGGRLSKKLIAQMHVWNKLEKAFGFHIAGHIAIGSTVVYE